MVFSERFVSCKTGGRCGGRRSANTVTTQWRNAARGGGHYPVMEAVAVG